MVRKYVNFQLTKGIFYYIIKNEQTKKKGFIMNNKNFINELNELSKKYGIVLKAIGGVIICDQEQIKDFQGYTTDLESGDLEPIWKD